MSTIPSLPGSTVPALQPALRSGDNMTTRARGCVAVWLCGPLAHVWPYGGYWTGSPGGLWRRRKGEGDGGSVPVNSFLGWMQKWMDGWRRRGGSMPVRPGKKKLHELCGVQLFKKDFPLILLVFTQNLDP